MAIFEETKTVFKVHVAANAKRHLTFIQKSGISHEELLGIISKSRPTLGKKSNSYRKQLIRASDKSRISKILGDMREADIRSEELPITTEAIN